MTEGGQPEFPAGAAERAGEQPLSNAELQIVLDTVRDLTSILSTAKIIERLLERILRHLDSEVGSVLVVEEDGSLRIMVARGLPDQVIEETRIATGEGISGWVAKTLRPLLVENIEADDRFQRRNHERYYTRSFLSAPLVMGRTLYGVLNVNNKSNRCEFTPADLRLVEAIAGHAALALNAAHRYEAAVAQARRDPLTGLLNHRGFWESLDTEVERARRYKRALSVVMVDIDHFKNYNDAYGHLEGDAALEGVAQLIDRGCRITDLTGRCGGEEFAVVLPETGLEGARTVAEKIRVAVEGARFSQADDRELTVSAGVASYPADGASAKDLMRRADERLYRAKAEGRNRVVAS